MERNVDGPLGRGSAKDPGFKISCRIPTNTVPRNGRKPNEKKKKRKKKELNRWGKGCVQLVSKGRTGNEDKESNFLEKPPKRVLEKKKEKKKKKEARAGEGGKRKKGR